MPKKILVADDSLTIQKVIRLALANEGYEIQTVSEGKEAIEQIALFHPDLCLIDVSLPRKNAFEVKREIQGFDDFKNLGFILMSSAFEKVDEKLVEELKFDGRLVKPFDPAHLRKTLAEVLAKTSAKAPPPSRPAAPAAETPLADDLWMTPEEVKGAAPFEPPPPFEDDIRKLTESTLQMSNIDALGWSVNDPSRKLDPFSPTPSDPPPLDLDAFSIDQPSVRDASPFTPPPPMGGGLDAGALRAEVERAVRAIFPEIAERVIREEIHRLLQNPPKP